FHKLTAIRDLKASQLNSWIGERKSDLSAISRDSEIRQLAGVLINEELTKNDKGFVASAKNILDSFVEEYRAYDEIFIVDASTGIVEFSTQNASKGLNVSEKQFFIEPLKTGSPYIGDIYYSHQSKRPAMCFSRPIRSLSLQGRKQFAIMVARVDLTYSLYNLLLERTGMGKTGETLIVNKDLMALNDLRWQDNAPLRLKIKAKPAVLASQGNAGIIEALDYRGTEVLASYTYLPETRWGFVAKQDLSEIYAPISKMLFNIAIILLASALSAYGLAHMLAINFSKPIIEFTKVAAQIQAGNLSVRCAVKSEDEYGVLANALNSMIESIETYGTTQMHLRNLDEILVKSATVDDFGIKFIEKLVEITDSAFGTFYLFNSNKKRFEHIHSIGFDNESLKSLDENVIKDTFDRASTTGKITYIRKISRDAVFTVNTIAGPILPRNMVTIPIFIKKRVTAIIALGSLDDYSETTSKILKQVQSSSGTALSNIISTEKAVSLAHELKNNNVELEAQAQELKAMTDDLKRQNTELDIASRQVEEASRMKSVFLSNMSHELRTPLNSVMALSSVLKMTTAEKLTQEELEYLDVIERNGKRLLDLINDILDLSKIEAGHMDVGLSFFQLKTSVENVIDSLMPLAREKNLSLRMEMPPDLPKIQSDERRVHQILVNIVNNAIKFTEKGNVTVWAYHEDNRIYVKVIDTGIGIAEKDLPFIFEEFKQVDGSTSRRHEGTGLGLAIASKVALKLGGKLLVESQPGQGTTFTLILPVKWLAEAQRIEAISPSKVKPSKIAVERKTVLVVDDESDALELITDYLFREGYNTLTATSGKDALRLAEEYRPFAITLDLIMPEMDGFETLQLLKQNPVTSDIPVIIVSVSEDRRTGMALGAIGHVTKPVIRDELIKEIYKVCVKPTSIMVTDDNEIDRNNIMRILNQENIPAASAENGKTCIEKIRETAPDVLVLDLMMPEMDGFDVLQVLRSDPLTLGLPVIIVTAKDLTREEKEVLNQFVVSVLYKSDLTPETLLEEIGSSLRQIKNPIESGIVRSVPPTGKRILVVEDNDAARVQVKIILEQAGYRVDVASGGREARKMVEQTIPDGIILDLMMPDVDGFDVLESVRSTEETAEIPVLILTAKDLTPDDFKRLSHNNIQQLVQKGDVEREGLLLKVKIMLGETARTSDTITDKAESMEEPRIKPQRALTPGRKLSGSQELPIILVVEDNPDNMLTIKAVLKNKYSIIEAIDGEKGLIAVIRDLPDLVLLDISLPGMDGYTVVKEMKKDENAKNIPVIALTAHAMKGDREKAISAGCDDYLSKPIDTVKIQETIKKWLEQT
ncbi:response regulator, partial [Desulfobacterales bacterium HSG16]|nr:response regulator [Desulfobacterales bacterium HSG16]